MYVNIFINNKYVGVTYFYCFYKYSYNIYYVYALICNFKFVIIKINFQQIVMFFYSVYWDNCWDKITQTTNVSQ